MSLLFRRSLDLGRRFFLLEELLGSNAGLLAVRNRAGQDLAVSTPTLAASAGSRRSSRRTAVSQ